MNKNLTIPPIVVAGGGHAGIEAANAIAKTGINVIIVTLDTKSIGRMSCNPAIGGLAKGHLVKELDAMGGLMGYYADASCLQFKTLNKSKGRAVWSPRAQVDKILYSKLISKHIEQTKNIKVIKGEVVGFKTKTVKISHVKLADKSLISCSALIITSGTFLNGTIHIGETSYPAGRLGEKPSIGLTEELEKYGLKTSRLKTGTPPRLLKNSINFNYTETTYGETNPFPFSIKTKKQYNPKNEPCYIVNTTEKLHEIIGNNVKKSPMYSGKIKGIGPRYCPSFEDKIIRFADKKSHQLFLEPEWINSNQIYLNGFSTSLPKKIQISALKEIKAFKNIKLIRPGYAIEYDYLPSHNLKNNLETKKINGLFLAGQINGTSGYEEAAAQGMMAGINAAQYALNKEPLTILRSEGYIGVLIDDLVTKHLDEPYRMFTSSAEYRITLRPETAYIRLTEKAINFNLISRQQSLIYSKMINEYTQCKRDIERSKNNYVNKIKSHKTDYIALSKTKEFNKYSLETLYICDTEIRYEGYAKREKIRQKKLSSIENKAIPQKINYKKINNLTKEAKEKLSKIKPETLGQASRIGGVSPADTAALSIHLKL